MSGRALNPVAIEVHHLEAPLSRPRRNAFGTMYARPALLIRLIDADGTEGWGEVFCNWPAFAAPYRSRILGEILAPRLLGRRFASPEDLWNVLTAETRRIVIQANEPGPFEQCIAGLDIAGWDLAARRAGVPLHALLGDADATVPAYASALTHETLADIVPDLAAAGWRGFKLKAGFGTDRDRAAFADLRDLAGPDVTLMADANQAWTLAEAVAAGEALARHNLAWLEEPLMADRPATEWRHLHEMQPIPLAAGENIRGFTGFADMMRDGALAYVQPDAAKWGGLSALRSIGQAAAQAGLGFAPHYLGGGIGLLATAHAAQALNAAWLEVDVTENPLRAVLHGSSLEIAEGMVRLGDTPGLGTLPQPSDLRRFAAGPPVSVRG